MQYRIKLNVAKCVGCGGCVAACIDQNDTPVAAGAPTRRRVETRERMTERGLRVDYLSLACTHCGRCIPVCPQGCLRRDDDTGFVVFDSLSCVGCGACAAACPSKSAAVFQGRVTKCDGCWLRVKHGYEPACVRGCITGALYLEQVSSGADSPVKNKSETR